MPDVKISALDAKGAAMELDDIVEVTVDPGGTPVTKSLTGANILGMMEVEQQASLPAFLAFVSPTVSNVTGDGTVHTIIWPGERWDQDSNHDVTTGIFTAPTTAKYIFSICIYILNGGTANQYTAILSTSNRAYTFGFNNVVAARDDFTINATLDTDMDANDTAKVTITFSGGTKTVDILGSSAIKCFWTGRKAT